MKENTGRYRTATGIEGQSEPGSRGRVLRNLLGIQRKRDMDLAEFEALVRTQTLYLRQFTPETRLTAAAICDMHRAWLGSIYEWAGRYRTVELEKGGFRWPPAFRVPENMAVFEKGLLRKYTPCRPATLAEVARRIAEVHAELLMIHPFRDGNGRLARWLADIMAFQAGFPAPAYRFQGRGGRREGERYLAAVKKGYRLEFDDLTAFFREAIERRTREGE